MSELIVLSERDCSKELKKIGITPKAIYTSINKCERALTYESDVKLVIIFMGLCRFNMPRVISFYKKLLELSDNQKEQACVKHTRILSDVQIIGVNHFYKYDRGFSDIYKATNIKYLGFYTSKTKVDFWKELDFVNSEECKVYEDKDNELMYALDKLSTIKKNPEYDKLIQ